MLLQKAYFKAISSDFPILNEHCSENHYLFICNCCSTVDTTFLLESNAYFYGFPLCMFAIASLNISVGILIKITK